MGKRIPVPDTDWNSRCPGLFGAALVLTLCAMMLNLRAVWRYVRYDVMP